MKRCLESTADATRLVQVDYTERREVKKGTKFTYRIAADARTDPAAATDELPTGQATSKDIVAQCELGARLVAVDPATLTVSKADGENQTEAGWQYKPFDENGKLTWSWTVTAAKLGAHELSLQLKPAVTAESRIPDVRLDSTVTYTSTVVVTGSMLDRTTSWFEDNKGKISLVGGGIATAILGTLTFLGKTRDAWDKLLRRSKTIDLTAAEKATAKKAVSPKKTTPKKTRKKP